MKVAVWTALQPLRRPT